MSEPLAAPQRAPLELKLKIMLRNWSYPEFREIPFTGRARECEDNRYKRLYTY